MAAFKEGDFGVARTYLTTRLRKALGADTTRCPACGNGITKGGGCNHVLCAPPGGAAAGIHTPCTNF